MESTIAHALKLRFAPVAIEWADDKPEGAMQFIPGRWGCVMAAFAAVAERGRVAVFDRETYGCWGGGVGLGFGNCYERFPGGMDGFCGFLSDGNDKSPTGRAVVEACAGWMRGSLREDFLHGERYRRTPERVRGFVQSLPITQVPAKYVIFKPLSQVRDGQTVPVIVFLADADQTAALVVLANYDRADTEGAIIPHAAGCQSLGILTYREAASDRPRAVVGLNDPSARRTVRKLGKDLLTVSVPWQLFQKMEAHVQDSFLEKAPMTELLSAD